MPKLSHAVILTAVLAATPAFAGADTKVLDHHVANIGASASSAASTSVTADRPPRFASPRWPSKPGVPAM